MAGSHTLRRSHVGIFGLSAALAAGGLIGIASPAVAVDCQQSGATRTCMFTDPENAETWPVPAGVTSALFTLHGGSGGSGGDESQYTATQLTENPGGNGGTTIATKSLSGISSLRIWVGGGGGDAGNGDGDICGSDAVGGFGGKSGGIQTGGDGGPGASSGLCAGGGGGGGTYVMTNGQTPEQINDGAIPFLVAGGGGGGGGSEDEFGPNGGGRGGGNSSGSAENGDGTAGGSAGAIDSIFGQSGAPAESEPPYVSAHAGGGGGGGYAGGGGGGPSGGINTPASGGGGGTHTPYVEPEPEPIVAPATAIPASSPAESAGPGSPTRTTAGSVGSVSIEYTLPPSGAPAAPLIDTDQCLPSDDCVVNPPPGEQSEFQVTGFGGKDGATLFAILNGGRPPTCKSVGGTLSPDWVQFGFKNPRDGKTWSKKIQETGINPTSKEQAQRILAQTQICFAAPYKFVVKRGEKLIRVGNLWEGVLAHCRSRILAEAKREQPDLARPCILNRQLVQKGDGWAVRVNYFVPNGELDPQGRSLRKKKKTRG